MAMPPGSRSVRQAVRGKGSVYRNKPLALRSRGGTVATEVVWCNFDPSALSSALAVEYSCLGDDYRERERVGRKLKRWANKLRCLPARVRRALLFRWELPPVAIPGRGGRNGSARPPA